MGSYSLDTGGLSAVKQPERDSGKSCPSSVVVKIAWIYTSTAPYAFMVWSLIKHQENFTFAF
jgi:hypothetical protein